MVREKPAITGFFNSLTPEQQKAALKYRGPENHGDPEFRILTKEQQIALMTGVEKRLTGYVKKWLARPKFRRAIHKQQKK